MIEKFTNSPTISISHKWRKLKIAFLILLFSSIGNSIFAATYYSYSTGTAPHTVGNWWTATNGTGGHPANFTTVGDIFIVQSGFPMTTTSTWSLTGSLVINDGGIFTNAGHAMTITGTTTIGGGTSGSLIINSSSGAKTFGGLITVNAGATWNNSGNSDIVIRGGITRTGTFTAGTGTYTFNTTSPQALTGTFSFTDVTITAITLNPSAALTIGGTLTLSNSASSILDMGTSQLLGATTYSLGASSFLKTACTSNPPFAGGNITAGTVEFTAVAGGQFVPGITYKILLLDNTSGTNTALGNLVFSGSTFTTAAGGTFDMTTYSISGTITTLTHAGILKTSCTTSPPFTTNKTWGGTVEYTKLTGGQFIPQGTYNILLLDNTSGTNTVVNNDITVTTFTTAAGGTTDMVTYDLVTGTTINHSGILKTQSTSSTPLPLNKTWGGTVEYNANGNQKVVNGTYNILTVSTGGTKTLLTPSATANSTFTVGSGAIFADGGFVLTAKGNVVMTGDHTGVGSITLSGGSAPHDLSGAGTFTNLIMNDAQGATLSSSITVGTAGATGVLTLTSGKISLNNFNLLISKNSATAVAGLSGGSSTSYIVTNGTGLFKRTIGAAGTYNFPLGSATAYNPASFVWAAAPGITQLDAIYNATTPSVGAGLPASVFNGCLTVSALLDNGYWTFAKTGILTNNYNVTLTRNGHTNAGANQNNHAIVTRTSAAVAWAGPGSYSDPGSAAISPANTGQVGAITHTSANDNLSGDFAISKGTYTAPPTVAAIGGGATVVCLGSTSSAFTDATAGGTWSITGGTGTATIDAAGVVTGVTSGTITVNYTVSSGSCATVVTNTSMSVYSGGTATPSATFICDGSTITLTVAGNSGTKQWEQNVNGGGWVNISGCSNCGGSPVTTAALTYPNTYQYRVKSQATCAGTATAVITTQQNTTTVADAGANGFACNDAYTLAGNTPAGGETGVWTKILGTGTITTPSSPTSGLTGLGAGINNFVWSITSGVCTSTDSISITEGAYDAFVSYPCIFNAATVDLTLGLPATYNNNTIQWEQNVNNAGWVNIVGSTAPTATPNTTAVLTTNTATPPYYQYRAKLTTGGCTDYSAIVTVGGSYCATTCKVCTTAPCVNTTASGCTWTVAANDATARSITGGAKLCITGGTYTGAITIPNSGTGGSIIVSGGAFNPSSISSMNSSAAVTIEIQSGATAAIPSMSINSSTLNFNNCGTTTWDGLSNNSSTVNLNNIGTLTWTGDLDGNSCTCSINNSGTMDATGQSISTNSGNTFCNSGSMTAQTISMNSTGAINNSGTITITGNASMNSCNPCINVCPNSNFNIHGTLSGNSATITGISTCGAITVTGGASFNSTTMTGFDMCDALGTGTPHVVSCNSCTTSGMTYCTCSHVPLPIELLSFTAEFAGKNNVITQWITASEINNDYFTIQRTTDGESFTEIGKVKGAGNSNSLLQYNLFDENPIKGIAYYRLKQTDYDGNYAYSKLVSVDMFSSDPLKLLYLIPDQDKNVLQYQLSYSDTKPLSVEVVDVLGKVLSTQRIEFNSDGQPINMDVFGLSKGVYIFKVSDGTHSVIRKFFY